MKPSHLWICYAVRQEIARPHPSPSPKIIVTGMGPAKARQAVENQARRERSLPELVLTCGFAGGLNPKWRQSHVLFDCDNEFPWHDALQQAGALRGTFHPAERVVCAVADKAMLWHQTHADAVEMESYVIRDWCRSMEIPCATVRVISDAADQNLPLDFNTVLTADRQLHYGKLLWRLFRDPALIGKLRDLQRQTRKAASQLANVINSLVRSVLSSTQRPS